MTDSTTLLVLLALAELGLILFVLWSRLGRGSRSERDSGFALFTGRTRRRWPAMLALLLAIALPLGYFARRAAHEPQASTGMPTGSVTDTVTGDAPGAGPATQLPAPPAPPTEPEAPTLAAAPDPAPDIRAAVETWRKAWSDKDAATYLAAYADDFVPPDGLDPDTWRNQRRERLGSARHITLRIDRLDVSATGDSATARFRQHYRSGTLDEKVIKRLGLRRTPAGWKITEEVVETPGKR